MIKRKITGWPPESFSYYASYYAQLDSFGRDLRLVLQVLLYRSRGCTRQIRRQSITTEENPASLDGWWIQDSSEAAFDRVSLIHHTDKFSAAVQEQMRQQARNLRWFAAKALGMAIADTDEQIAQLFAVAQSNAFSLSDHSSLHVIGMVPFLLLQANNLCLPFGSGQGIYASAALLNHSCQPNAQWSVGKEDFVCLFSACRS